MRAHIPSCPHEHHINHTHSSRIQQFSCHLQVPELQIPQLPNAIAKSLEDCVPGAGGGGMMAVKVGASFLLCLVGEEN